MGSDRRHTLNLKIEHPDLKSLIDLGNQMTQSYRDIFVNRYGKILDLLTVDVKTDALSALVQYYDPPLRCFTFKDFQLAPTLEEFGLIMGYSLEKGNPFRGIGQFPTPKTIIKVLNIDISKMEIKRTPHGFSREYLEKKAQELADENQWDAFIDLLALIIYGIVLFPNMDNFVDLAAIGVFLAYKQHNQNPVPAVLADVYYSLHVGHKKKKGRILCCLPVLYTWLISHIFLDSCFVEARGRSAWTQSLDNLNEDSILWYSQEQRVEEVIYSCGQFPNVPLIGTKGCINYNPTLALRQLGYPIVDKPADLLLKDFVLHAMGKEDPEMLRRVSRAWKNIHRKGQELRCRSYGVKDTYSQWVKDRVKEIKLPWVRTSKVVEETPVQSVNINDEIEKLKASPLKEEEEIKNLQEELKRVRQAYEVAQSENEISLERANKRAKVEEECKIKIQHNLQASNEQLKNLLKVSKIAEMNMQRELEVLKEQLKKVTAEYESQVKYERQQNEEMQGILTEYQDALRKAVEDLSEHKKFIADLLNIKREFPTP